ncbi:MAG: hypothetical protein V1800_00740 [Candidatus Latescibacterota bacterium]
MKTNLIVMLTYNDVTVENALDLFEASKDVPAKFWGFKDVGLDVQQMKQLVGRMKAAGKTTFLEVVHYGEKEGLQAAQLALECGVDYLTGTIFHDSILELVKDRDIQYFPFFGNIYGHPVVLGGQIDEIVRHGKELEDKGVDGLDLVAYRYEDSEKVEELVRRCAEEIGVPLILAGSVDSWSRVEEVKGYGVWAFTIGSAFFDKQFLPESSFEEQIRGVHDNVKK